MSTSWLNNFFTSDDLPSAIEKGDIASIDRLATSREIASNPLADKNNLTPLQYAFVKKQIGSALALLLNNVDVNVKGGSRNNPPIFDAIQAGDYSFVDLLMFHNADITLTNHELLTPLQFAQKYSFHKSFPNLQIMLSRIEQLNAALAKLEDKDASQLANEEAIKQLKIVADIYLAQADKEHNSDDHRYKDRAGLEVHYYGKALGYLLKMEQRYENTNHFYVEPGYREVLHKIALCYEKCGPKYLELKDRYDAKIAKLGPTENIEQAEKDDTARVGLRQRIPPGDSDVTIRSASLGDAGVTNPASYPKK